MNARTQMTWKIAVVACAALLLVAIGAIVVIETQASSARGRQNASVMKLDKQLVGLHKQLADQQAAAAAAASAAGRPGRECYHQRSEARSHRGRGRGPDGRRP